MAFNPAVDFRSDKYIFEGISGAFDRAFSGFAKGMDNYAAGRKEKQAIAEQRRAEENELKGIQAFYDNDNTGIAKQLLGDNFDAVRMGSGQVQAQMKAAADAAKVGRELLAMEQQKQVGVYRDGLKKAMGEFDGDMAKFTQSLLGHGVNDPEVIKQAQGIVATMTEAGWKPTRVNADGVDMVMTSPNSAVPLKAGEQPGNPGEEIPVGKTGFSVVDLGNGRRQVIDTRNKRSVDPFQLYIAKQAGAISEEQYKRLLQAQYSDLADGAGDRGGTGGFFDDL